MTKQQKEELKTDIKYVIDCFFRAEKYEHTERLKSQINLMLQAHQITLMDNKEIEEFVKTHKL